MIEKTGQQGDPRLRLNLRQLEVFVATARSGSTRGAADRMARSQSAASAALTALEAAIGAPLFDRVGRRLVLNESGRALLAGAVALLDQAAELQGGPGQAQRTPLRIAASLTIGEYLLPERIARWKLEHAANSVRMMIGNSSEVIRAVADMEADVGFIEGAQTHADVRVRKWLEDELVIVAAPAHPLAQGQRPVATRQLAEASWILREPGSGTRQAADAWLLEHLDALQIEYELGSPEAIKRLAAAGAGLACMSRHAVGVELASGRLVEVRTRLPPNRRRLAIVVRRDRRLGRATEAFVRHCTG